LTESRGQDPQETIAAFELLFDEVDLKSSKKMSKKAEKERKRQEKLAQHNKMKAKD